MVKTVSWTAGLSQRRPGFISRSTHVRLVLQEVVLVRAFLRVTRVFPCQYHSTNAQHSFTLLSPTPCNIGIQWLH
jgi:hypothetical protein